MLLILLAVLTILLTANNMQRLELRFYSSDYVIETSVNMLIFICFFTGGLIGSISSIIYYGKKMRNIKMKLKQSELEKKALQQQIYSGRAEKNALMQISDAL